jgi:hypothetical protein
MLHHEGTFVKMVGKSDVLCICRLLRVYNDTMSVNFINSCADEFVINRQYMWSIQHVMPRCIHFLCNIFKL